MTSSPSLFRRLLLPVLTTVLVGSTLGGLPAAASPAGARPAINAPSTLSSASGPAGAASPTLARTTTSVIGDGTSCRYLNRDATPVPSGWRSPGSALQSWPVGILPMGHLEKVRTDVGVPTQTVYVGCAFTVPADRRPAALEVTAAVDDGAVLYLNGKEFARYNMPSGPVTRSTNAARIDPWDGKRWVTYTVPTAHLRSGSNVLAAEVHAFRQGTWRSGDAFLGIRARLTTDPLSPAPPSKPVQPTQPANPTVPALPGWRLHWSDEFTAGQLDRSRWAAYHSDYGSRDLNMLHCLTPNNVTTANGSLLLTARRERVTCPNAGPKDYTSGFVGSRDAKRWYPLFGRYEIRARAPHGQGLFPAIWLRFARGGAAVAEVDIFEQFHSSAPGQATQTLHFPTTLGYHVAKKGTKYETAVPGRGGWHVYSVDITPLVPGDRTQGKFRFAIDGVTTFEYVNRRMGPWAAGVDPMQAWDIALQLYVGGTWAGHPDRNLGWYAARGGSCAQTGRRVGTDASSCPTTGIWLAPWQDAVLEIDYVRVYTPM